MKKKIFRNLHRDLGYIDLSFPLSFPLMMNHRDMWHPENISRKLEQLQLPEKAKLMILYILGKKLGIDDKMRRQSQKKNV
jgi:hypothetical protein